MTKKYRVWVKVSVEEIDGDNDVYRNVIMDGDELVEYDGEEISVFESTDYHEAKDWADIISQTLEELS
jgi:hypothetical protein